MIDLIPYIPCFWNKKKLFELTLFVTNSCNFNCPFCFNSENKVKDMSLNEINEIAKKTGNFYRLLISGGEPFIRKDLFYICQSFIHNCNVKRITIPTNGYFTDRMVAFVRDMSAHFPNIKLNISFSVDNIGIKRDNLVKVSGSWDRLLESIDRIRESKYKNLFIGSITTQCVQNENELFDIYYWLKGSNLFDYFSFNIARGTKADLSIYRKFTNFLKTNNKKKLGIPLIQWKDNLVYDAVYKQKDFTCHSGGVRKVIRSDGKIYPCETLMYGNNCPCWHECDLATNLVFDFRNIWKLFSR